MSTGVIFDEAVEIPSTPVTETQDAPQETPQASQTQEQTTDTGQETPQKGPEAKEHGAEGTRGEKEAPAWKEKYPDWTLEKAKRFIREINAPDDLIEGLPDERVIEWGVKAKKRSDDQAREFAEKHRLEQLLAKIEQERNGSDTRSTRPNDPAPPYAAEGADSSNINWAALENELGAEAVKIIRQAVTAQNGQAGQPIATLQQQYDNRIAELEKRHVHDRLNDQFESTCDRLVYQGKHAVLSDDDSRQKIHGKAFAMLGAMPEEYIADGRVNMSKLVNDAMAVAYSNQTIKQTQEQIQKRYALESQGVPSSRTTADSPKQMTRDERDKIAYRMLMKENKSVDDVKRVLSGV